MSTLPRIPRWRTAVQSLTEKNIPLKRLSKLIFQKGSTVQLYAGGVYSMILTADPDFIRHILQKNPRKYSKSTRQFNNIKRFLGNGLLTSDGAYWLKQRRLIQPGFHKNRLREVLKLMDSTTDQYLDHLDTALQSNPEVDISEKMQDVTLRIIAHSIFSASLEEAEFQKIKTILPRLQAFILQMFRLPYLHWWLKLSGQIKEHEELRDEVNAIYRSYIQKRRASGEEQDDLLQMLLDVRYADTGEGMTDTQILDEINILFNAGHEPTATALSWTWYLLGKHPEIMKKLETEVDQVLPDQEVTYQRLAQLEYTQQVIEETVRLYPPAWATNRIALEDDEFNGITIKKGTTISNYIYGLHRSPELWENPELFQPERFTKEQKKARHPFAYVPFGGGPRLCIGKQFATMEMKLILAKMIKRYKATLVKSQNIETIPVVTLQPNKAIKMQLEQREVSIPSRDEHIVAVNKHPMEVSAKASKCPFAALFAS